MCATAFEPMLTGGHPSSLGRTLEVVDAIMHDATRLAELYQCYFSSDEVVRLRTSSAMKRIARAQPAWLVPYIDQFLGPVAAIDQASTQWTLANLFQILADDMRDDQKARAQEHLKHNLATHNDWIVLINTMETLAAWSEHNAGLRTWLVPHLERLSGDTRKSVAKCAGKLRDALV